MSTVAPVRGVSPRALHPWKEIVHRARDPRFVADSALRALTQLWDQVSPSEFSALYRQVRSYTMCSNARLRGLYRAVHHVVAQNIPGDIVECGAARGGSAALMALTLRQLRVSRRIWLFDTFAGLPAPSQEDPDFDIADLFTGTCVGPLEEVRAMFERLGISDNAVFVKGLFQDTLPTSSVTPIAVLHIDGDWFESVKTCLESLYDRVVPGGIIQFDDYGYWQGARKAVDDFLKQRRIATALQPLDYSGRYLVKPQPASASVARKSGASIQKSSWQASDKALTSSQ
jgi:predicted O-methyltransferase YrrM